MPHDQSGNCQCVEDKRRGRPHFPFKEAHCEKTRRAKAPLHFWVLVVDRGLLRSLDDLEALDELRRASGRALEFILVVPGRRYQEFAELLDKFHRTPTSS
jgi:hypothetical protein